jgi:hypothetical protein
MVKEEKQSTTAKNVTKFEILTNMSSEQNQFCLPLLIRYCPQQLAKGVK